MTVFSIKYDSAEYWQAVRLREIELRLPLNMRFNYADLKKEKDEWIFGVKIDGKIVATCQYIVQTAKAKMRQVATKKSYQGLGLGKQLYFYTENLLLKNGIQEVYCHARVEAVPFYKKLDFQIDSEGFLEVGIPHCIMRKQIKNKPNP